MAVRPTELSLFGFGVGWEFKKSERETAQQLLDFLDGRRIVTVDANRPAEDAESCIASAQECRERLSELLGEVSTKSVDLRGWLRGLRRAFMTFVEAGERGGFQADEGYVRFRHALYDLHVVVQAGSDLVAERYKLTGLRVLR